MATLNDLTGSQFDTLNGIAQTRLLTDKDLRDAGLDSQQRKEYLDGQAAASSGDPMDQADAMIERGVESGIISEAEAKIYRDNRDDEDFQKGMQILTAQQNEAIAIRNAGLAEKAQDIVAAQYAQMAGLFSKSADLREQAAQGLKDALVIPEGVNPEDLFGRKPGDVFKELGGQINFQPVSSVLADDPTLEITQRQALQSNLNNFGVAEELSGKVNEFLRKDAERRIDSLDPLARDNIRQISNNANLAARGFLPRAAVNDTIRGVAANAGVGGRAGARGGQTRRDLGFGALDLQTNVAPALAGQAISLAEQISPINARFDPSKTFIGPEFLTQTALQSRQLESQQNQFGSGFAQNERNTALALQSAANPTQVGLQDLRLQRAGIDSTSAAIDPTSQLAAIGALGSGLPTSIPHIQSSQFNIPTIGAQPNTNFAPYINVNVPNVAAGAQSNLASPGGGIFDFGNSGLANFGEGLANRLFTGAANSAADSLFGTTGGLGAAVDSFGNTIGGFGNSFGASLGTGISNLFNWGK